MYDIAVWAVGFASGLVFGILVDWATHPSKKEKKP